MERAREADGKAESRTEKKGLIHIPSYQEVFSSFGGDESSSSRPYNPLPPTSFSQAFSFIKSSEFYTPPPSTEPPKEQEQKKVSDPLASDPASASCSSSYSAPSSAQNRNAILVSHRQKGNPLLKHVRNVKWTFADIVCDYLVGQSSCALYLSLRYHLLHPDYLYYRIRELQKDFKLRVVLCHIDVEDAVKPLLEVTRTAIFHDCSLLCGWSLEECGRYLETLKVYENKPADIIREQTDTDYLSRLTHALTTVRHVNKTDVLTLGSTFGSLSGIMDASMEDLARCPGIGERKVKRLYDTFHEPFRRVPRRPPVTIPKAFSKARKDHQPSIEGGGEEPGIDEGRPNSSSEAEAASNDDVRSALDAAFTKYGRGIGKQPDQKRLPTRK